MSIRSFFCVLAMASLAILGGTAQATLIATSSPLVGYYDWQENADVVNVWAAANSGQLPINATTDLLINHLASPLTYAGTMGYTSIAKNINDGLMISSVLPSGSAYVSGTSDNDAIFADGGVLTFHFDHTYDVTGMDTFTLTQMYRNGQKYTVDVSTNGGASWSTLKSVNFDAPSAADSYAMRRVSLTDNSAPVAAGVDAIRFTFSDPFVGNPPAWTYGLTSATYGEIAVYGTATATPEPGAVVLLATGLIGLLAYAWRKRR